MERDINDFVRITKLKNGKVKFVYDKINERNALKLLWELGYRKTILDKKLVYFQRREGQLVPVEFREIKEAFKRVLEEYRFINIPQGVAYHDIMNWYYLKEPIKRNALFNEHMTEEVSDKAEVHALRLQVDDGYKSNFELCVLQSKLNEWGFNKQVNLSATFGKGNPLYHKKIGEKEFLVFVHRNSDNNKVHDIFECWMTKYLSEKHIGKTPPFYMNELRLGFHLDRDYNVIKEFVE